MTIIISDEDISFAHLHLHTFKLIKYTKQQCELLLEQLQK